MDDFIVIIPKNVGYSIKYWQVESGLWNFLIVCTLYRRTKLSLVTAKQLNVQVIELFRSIVALQFQTFKLIRAQKFRVLFPSFQQILHRKRRIIWDKAGVIARDQLNLFFWLTTFLAPFGVSDLDAAHSRIDILHSKHKAQLPQIHYLTLSHYSGHRKKRVIFWDQFVGLHDEKRHHEGRTEDGDCGAKTCLVFTLVLECELDWLTVGVHRFKAVAALLRPWHFTLLLFLLHL